TLWVNGVLNALTIVACALITPETPRALSAALLFVSGLTRSMQFTALNTLAFSEVPQPRMGGANTLFNKSQQLGGGLGIALGALALRAGEWLAPGSGAAPSLAAFHFAFIMMGLLALLAVADTFTLGTTAGDSVRQKTLQEAAGARRKTPADSAK
ncbi:MAG: MFS transporter, partial [Yersiniaceae bacterium]|nr:MFS transporter [Yersiniaceae bacterium]